MNLSNVKLSKNLLLPLTKILFFVLFAAFGAAGVNAQDESINGDLTKSAKGAKTPVTRRTTPVRTPPKPKSPVVKKYVARPVYKVPPRPAPTTLPVVVAAAPAPAPPAPPVQTPSEIFDRFMNFERSSGVTSQDWESVVKQTSAILKTTPNDKTAKAQLALAQAELAFNRADFAGALSQFNAAAGLLPDSALPAYGIGRVYLNTKQPREAENSFERAVRLKKDFALAYKGLGDALSAQGKTKKAQDYLKQAERLGGGAESVAANNSAAAGSNNQNGLSGGTAAAAPESEYDRDFKVARNYTARKKWQLALNKLEPLLAAGSPSADLYIAIGDNYFGLEAWVSALQAYRKAADINPNSALAFYKSGMVLFETNEFQAASEAFENALILDQSGATINRSLARKMADKANEKVRDMNKEVKKKGL